MTGTTSRGGRRPRARARWSGRSPAPGFHTGAKLAGVTGSVGKRLFGTLIAASTAFLLLAATASAATFTVTDDGDGADAAIDGSCDDGTSAPNCTLRAAIQEANAT